MFVEGKNLLPARRGGEIGKRCGLKSRCPPHLIVGLSNPFEYEHVPSMPTRRRWFAVRDAVQAGSTGTWFDDSEAQVRPLQGLADIDRPGLNLEDAESGDEAQGRQAGQDHTDDIGRE